jgi:hypothetical protein
MSEIRGREGKVSISCFDAFFSREPETTSLENAIGPHIGSFAIRATKGMPPSQFGHPKAMLPLSVRRIVCQQPPQGGLPEIAPTSAAAINTAFTLILQHASC